MLSCAPEVRASLIYDDTTTDTGDSVFFSLGPYAGLGDQIQLSSAGAAGQAAIEMFNQGGAGTFDAQLTLSNVGSPVGSTLGIYNLTNISTTGGDVLDMSFNLGGVSLPQNVVFTVSVSNVSDGVDLGVDMFEPPAVGSSDNSFMIVNTGGVYSALATNSENVYFQLTAAPAPEPASVALFATGLLGIAVCGWRKKRQPQVAV